MAKEILYSLTGARVYSQRKAPNDFYFRRCGIEPMIRELPMPVFNPSIDSTTAPCCESHHDDLNYLLTGYLTYIVIL